jgi:hypothetical protein
LIAAAEVLAAAARRATAIRPRRIFLRGIIVMAEILRSRSVRFRLAFFGFGVHLRMREGIGIVMFFDGGLLVVIVNQIHVIDVLVNVTLVVAVRVVQRFSLGEFVMRCVFAVLDSLPIARFACVAQRFARQHFGVHGHRNRRGCGSMRLRMPMPVFVIFEIFENVADIQEGVAVETDVHKSGLHTREHSCYAALVDATDKRELFFALDVDFD